ncbi:MAG: hypothetical protein GY906_23400, partial [bacterium]|nr:hypothetical protein [bacterium]
NDENVLGEAKRQSKGTITLESIPGIVSSTATECANAVINQFGITCAIKALEKKLLVEQDPAE